METTFKYLEVNDKAKKTVQSLTRKINLHETKKGDFFLKLDKEKKEYKSLKALRESGVLVPDHYYLMDTEQLAIKDSGLNLMEYLKSNPREFPRVLNEVQALMIDTHFKIQSINSSILTKNSGHTSHPIRNYVHRFIDLNSAATNSFLEIDSSDFNNFDFSSSEKVEFEKLYNILISIIESFMNQAGRISHEIDEDVEIAFGDYKPENIIINNSNEINLIDPELINGSKWFDVTKFISRLILDEFSVKKTLRFLKKYDKNKNLESQIYRSFSIRDLIHIDMINILSSYLGRFIKEENDYRITQRFYDEKMSQKIQGILNQRFDYLFD